MTGWKRKWEIDCCIQDCKFYSTNKIIFFGRAATLQFLVVLWILSVSLFVCCARFTFNVSSLWLLVWVACTLYLKEFPLSLHIIFLHRASLVNVIKLLVIINLVGITKDWLILQGFLYFFIIYCTKFQLDSYYLHV